MNENWTGGQYSLYRALLGAFLVVHFSMLVPFGAELFGAGGVLASASLSPYIGKLPNPLGILDSPAVVVALLWLGVASGVAVALGWFDRAGAVLAALILGWLYQRNPLIANPSLPLLGFLLVLHAFVPPRPFGSVAARRAGGARADWRLPGHLRNAAWVVLALSYSHSGITKLFSDSWTRGETIRLVLENPLARDHWLRDLVLALPPGLLEILTLTVLWAEVLFAPLVLFRRVRPLMWTVMLFAQLGFLTFLNFADLTFPMLLAHALTFDPRWIGRRVPARGAVLLFDGECAFCHATVRFALMEDAAERLRFAPLAGPAAERLLAGIPRDWHGDSIVLIDERGHRIKSRAVAGVLERLGGAWWFVGKLLRLVPRPLADAGYDLVGRVRYRLAGKVTACPILPPSRVAT
jgi:predicted DCC family thiol-disulfide oxidoreductase YuxK